MTTYQVPGLAPNDFVVDFEDLLILYLWTKWTETVPPRGTTLTSLGPDINFRPGFPNYSVTYEILCVQTNTRVADLNDPHSWHFFTQLEIRIVAREITRDQIAVQLGNMERELERIINQYGHNDIPGIQDIIFQGRQRDYGNLSRNTATARGAKQGSRAVASASAASWTTSTWESVTVIECSYYKEIV